MQNPKPLFIALKTKHFLEFKDGTKIVEYRAHGPRWNKKVCVIGRRAVISRGYGKYERLAGTIDGFGIMKFHEMPENQNGVLGALLKKGVMEIACIGIKLDIHEKKAA